jgi:hypothetical protein
MTLFIDGLEDLPITEQEDGTFAYEDLRALSNRGLFEDYSVQELLTIEWNEAYALGTRGVDKIAIAVQLHPDTVAINSFLARLIGRGIWQGKSAIPGFPSLHASWRWNTRVKDHVLRLEFNPSDFSRDSGVELCPVFMMPYICEVVLKRVVQFADPNAKYRFQVDEETGEKHNFFPKGWTKNVLIQALDLAQDFLVSDERFMMEDMKYLKPKYKRGLANFLGGKLVETITHPAGEDTVILKIYDKWKERLANPKPGSPEIRKGHTRFEVHLPSEVLKAKGLTNLAKLTQPISNTVLEDYWEESTWGTPLVSKVQLLRSMKERGLTDEESCLVFTYLYMKERNLELPFMDRKIRRIRKLIKSLGMKFSEGLDQSNYTYGYLDIKTGQLITTIPNAISFSL